MTRAPVTHRASLVERADHARLPPHSRHAGAWATHHGSPTARARAAVAVWVVVVAVLSVMACTDASGPITRAGTSARGGGGGGDDPMLVGQWSRTVIFATDDGDIHSSQTIWSFQSDSTARRSVIATSVAAGIADTVIANARWEAGGTTVIITFEPPDSGVVSFDYRVQADTLTLGGLEFLRVD